MKALVRTKRQGVPKFKTVRFKGVNGLAKGISKYDKLTTRNANRSLTKGARQESKKNIQKDLDMSFE